ncbi:MAG: response regulator [Shimia sp.]
MTNPSSDAMVAQIGETLPYLRRYARALTGDQAQGDNYAAATLEAILETPESYDGAGGAKVGLFKVFHSIWSTSGATLDEGHETGRAASAQRHLAKLTAGTREALLLHTIEEMSFQEVGTVMGTSATEAEDLVGIAYREMSEGMSGRIMIIEDEAIIAVDLEGIVADMGHQATGVARTRDGARQLAEREKPDLILSDIQLADNSSGIDAVRDILESYGSIPVIFITAFPERLLTGEQREPAFLISKPYTEEQVRSAISQAMFFSSTEGLHA